MSSLYPEKRFSWEIRSVDALFCNGMTRVGDLSREAILSSIRDEQVSFHLKTETLYMNFISIVHSKVFNYHLHVFVVLQDLSVLRDEINKNLFNDKKFCKECITVCVKVTSFIVLYTYSHNFYIKEYIFERVKQYFLTSTGLSANGFYRRVH